jgi:hypothetical protein
LEQGDSGLELAAQEATAQSGGAAALVVAKTGHGVRLGRPPEVPDEVTARIRKLRRRRLTGIGTCPRLPR